MRKALNGNILKDGDKFIGFNLGSDFTAEHEWGIEDIRRDFGMDDNKIGIDKRTATIIPEQHLFFHEVKNFAVLICDNSIDSTYGWSDYLNGDKFKQELNKGQLSIGELSMPYYGEKNLATSWDEGGFGILVSAELIPYLKELYEAIKNKDISIWLGGGGVFENAGLVVAIRSRLPKKGLKAMLDADNDLILLKQADIATGIKDKLKKAGKGYYALSPSWAKKFKDKETKYPVIYWLNPQEQQKYNYGWYTVEDLEEWANDKGKIMMKK